MSLLLVRSAFRPYWAGQSVSAFGDAFRRLAILLSVYSLTAGSGPAIGALAAAEIVPTLGLSVVAGSLVDRYPKRVSLFCADVIRAGCSLLLIAATALGSLPAIYALVALAAAASVFAPSARHALLPHLVDRQQLQEANTLTVTGNQIALVAGPPLAALVYSVLGPGVAFAIDGATYLFSAACIGLMTSVVEPRRQRAGGADQFWTETAEGLAYFVRTPVLFACVLVAAGLDIAAGINNTVMVFFVSDELGTAPVNIAWLASLNGLVQVATGAALLSLARSIRPELLLVVSAVTLAAGGGIVALAWAFPVLLIGVAVTSLGNAPFNVSTTSIEQMFVESRYLGRAKGLLGLVSTLVFLGAASVSGLLVGVVGSRGLLTVSASFLVVTTLVAIAVVQPAVRSARRRGSTATAGVS